MARKAQSSAASRPRKARDYAAEYARRTAGKVKGSAEYKRARGHRIDEAAARREAERARKEMLGTLTTGEKASVRSFVRRLHAEMGWLGDVDDMIAEAIDYAQKVGIDKFREEIAYRREIAANPGSVDIAGLEWRTAAMNGFPDTRWYYYGSRKTYLKMAA